MRVHVRVSNTITTAALIPGISVMPELGLYTIQLIETVVGENNDVLAGADVGAGETVKFDV